MITICTIVWFCWIWFFTFSTFGSWPVENGFSKASEHCNTLFLDLCGMIPSVNALINGCVTVSPHWPSSLASEKFNLVLKEPDAWFQKSNQSKQANRSAIICYWQDGDFILLAGQVLGSKIAYISRFLSAFFIMLHAWYQIQMYSLDWTTVACQIREGEHKGVRSKCT